MTKDNTFYFSHDYNSRSDIKIQTLLSKKGYFGYGLFWAIIENLYNNANALPLNYDVLAYDLRTESKEVESIINDFELFVIKDGFFGSDSVQRRLDERNSKSVKARESANKRWNKSNDNANALRTHKNSNAIKESKVKESKIKEIKVNNNISEIKNFESVSNKSISKKKLIENFKEEILLNGADEKDLDDWINIRKEKKAQFSERALNTFLNECKKNNFPIHEAVKICADKGWAGFNFDWIKKENNGRTEQNDISNPKIGRARLSDYKELYRQMVDE